MKECTKAFNHTDKLSERLELWEGEVLANQLGKDLNNNNNNKMTLKTLGLTWKVTYILPAIVGDT